MVELWNRLSEKQKKALVWLGLAAIFGVGLFVLQPSSPAKLPLNLPAQTIDESTGFGSTQERWEKELATILNTMLGGKGNQVFLTMDRGSRLEIAYNLTEEERYSAEGLQDRRWTSSPVLLRNDGERKEMPLVLQQYEPTVRGVLVILDQEPSSELRLAVAKAVATVLQIPMYRIEVMFKQ